MQVELEDLKDIFRGLCESSVKTNLKPGEFTFKVDQFDGTYMGAIVNLGGTMYETFNSGDGIGGPARKNAEAKGLKFVPSNVARFK